MLVANSHRKVSHPDKVKGVGGEGKPLQTERMSMSRTSSTEVASSQVSSNECDIFRSPKRWRTDVHQVESCYPCILPYGCGI